MTFSGTPPAHFSDDTDFRPPPVWYMRIQTGGQFDMTTWSAGVLSVVPIHQVRRRRLSPDYTSPSTVYNAMGASMYGLSAGWAAMIIENDAPIFLSETERNNLVIDVNCVLE